MSVRGLARVASGLWAIGTALVLPYYGAEAFALHALGADQQQIQVPVIVHIRQSRVARSGSLRRWRTRSMRRTARVSCTAT